MNFRTASAIAFLLGKKSGFNPQDVEDFLAGFIKGVINENDLDKIEVCLKDASSLETELEQAITDFKNGDITHITEGIMIIGKMVQELPTDLGDCQAMQADLTRLESWAAIFSNPKALAAALAKNVPSNMSNIEQDIIKLMADVKTDEMFYAGEDIADILVQAVGPAPSSMPETLEITQW